MFIFCESKLGRGLLSVPQGRWKGLFTEAQESPSTVTERKDHWCTAMGEFQISLRRAKESMREDSVLYNSMYVTFVYLGHHMSRNGNWRNILHFSGVYWSLMKIMTVRLAKLSQYRSGKGTSHLLSWTCCDCLGDRAWGLSTHLHLVTLEPLRLSSSWSLLSFGFQILCYL